jgi:hypothetical protein
VKKDGKNLSAFILITILIIISGCIQQDSGNNSGQQKCGAGPNECCQENGTVVPAGKLEYSRCIGDGGYCVPCR